MTGWQRRGRATAPVLTATSRRGCVRQVGTLSCGALCCTGTARREVRVLGRLGPLGRVQQGLSHRYQYSFRFYFVFIIFFIDFIYLLMTVWRQSCGGGVRRRTRQCEAPRADGEGTEPCGLCPGEAEQTGPCNDYQAPNTVNLC